MKANSANWKNARIMAQKEANDMGGNRYVFEEWNGSLTIACWYPVDGTQFEIFKPHKEGRVIK